MYMWPDIIHALFFYQEVDNDGEKRTSDPGGLYMRVMMFDVSLCLQGASRTESELCKA